MKNFNPNQSLWITWERQPRNISMARLLGVQLCEIIINKPRLIKYPFLIFKTLTLLAVYRPRFVFVQNPSIVLSFLVTSIGNFFPMCVVVDAHNAGVYPLEGKSKLLNFFANKIISMANFVIVSNKNLAKYVDSLAGNALVFPDPLPSYPFYRSEFNAKENYDFLLICTWADDEPYQEVIQAFSELGQSFNLKVTGKYSKKISEAMHKSLPENIQLLGFISEIEYQKQLYLADFTIDLTLRNDCLVCGAYESIAMGVPGVISDSSVNRSVFYNGFVFSKNDIENIKKSVLLCVEQGDFLYEKIKIMKENHMKTIEEGKKKLLENLNKWCG